MTRIACIIIAHAARADSLPRVITSACAQGFDDIIVVDDTVHEGAFPRSLAVAPLTRTTIDSLIKRDVGTLATNADVLVYLHDDHTLAPKFGEALRRVIDDAWDVIVPNRNTIRGAEVVALNNGERGGYCGGHAGVFRRHVVTAKPWSAHAHHPNWDVLTSAEQAARGARFVWSPRAELCITDLNPDDPRHELADPR